MDDQQMGTIIALLLTITAITVSVDVCMGFVWWVLSLA